MACKYFSRLIPFLMIQSIVFWSLLVFFFSGPFGNANSSNTTDATTAALTSEGPSSIDTRGFNGMGIATIILALIQFLAPQNAYDATVPDKCTITMMTTNGGNCQTFVNCDLTDDIGTISDPPIWNVCYLNGRQYFTDPSIGDYSITFTEAGGVDGNTEDGLHHPILQVANVNNWDPIYVQDLADASKNNDAGGNLCIYGANDYDGTLSLICGIPTTGTDGAFGISSNTIVHSTGYKPGWCTFHLIQYQRNENDVGGSYEFDIILRDADKVAIGQVDHMAVDGNGHLDMDSNLPYVLVVSTGGADGDPVKFQYAGTDWTTDDQTHCELGAYDGGDRQGDCGFTCD